MTTDSDGDRRRLIEIRTSLGLTQTEMAHAIGMKLRAYGDIETGASTCRAIHLLAAERVSLRIAAERRDGSLIAGGIIEDLAAIAHDTVSAVELAHPDLARAQSAVAAASGQLAKGDVASAYLNSLAAAQLHMRAARRLRGETD